MDKDKIIIINISGRGDKDCDLLQNIGGKISMSNIKKAFEKGKSIYTIYYLR